MKRFKYIMLALVLCLGLIGGAYAWWTDQVAVEGTVATGNLDVKITQVGVGNWNNPNAVPWTSATSDIVEGGKTATFTINNLYPTPMVMAQNVQLYVLNNSTIPVKLDSVVFEKSGSDAVWQHLKGEVHLRIYDEGDNQLKYKNSGNFHFDSGIAGAIENLMAGEMLEPGWTMRLGSDTDPTGSIIIWLDSEAGNDTQNQNITFTLTFNWVQWNKTMP